MALTAPRLFNQARTDTLAAQQGYSLVIAVGAINVYYLSGHYSDWLFDVPRVSAALYQPESDTLPVLIAHDVEVTALAERFPQVSDVQLYQLEVCGVAQGHYSVSAEQPLDALESRALSLHDRHAVSAGGLLGCLREHLQGHPKGTTAVCDDHAVTEWLNGQVAGITVVFDPHFFTRVRLVKTPAELSIMQAAASRNRKALTDTVELIADGVAWDAIETGYRVASSVQGAVPFSLYVGAGRRSAGLHLSKDYPVRTGDQICFDAMLTYERYFADMQRTFVLGAPDTRLEDRYSAIRHAADSAAGELAPGVSTAAIRTLAVDTARRQGCGSFRHAFVHGLGLTHIELPFDTAFGFQDFVLEAGMVVNLDMEFCELGFGGVYLEDSYLVTDDGAERLTAMSRDLVAL